MGCVGKPLVKQWITSVNTASHTLGVGHLQSFGTSGVSYIRVTEVTSLHDDKRKQNHLNFLLIRSIQCQLLNILKSQSWYLIMNTNKPGEMFIVFDQILFFILLMISVLCLLIAVSASCTHSFSSKRGKNQECESLFQDWIYTKMISVTLNGLDSHTLLLPNFVKIKAV